MASSSWLSSSNNVQDNSGYTVTGLEPNQGYYVQVQAYNNDGAGDWSASANATTPATVPGQVNPRPAASMVTNDPSAITISWAAPSFTGGLPISGYRVAMDEFCDGQFSSQTKTTAATTLVWNGITPAVQYCFTVSASNAQGYGIPSLSSVQMATTGTAEEKSVSFAMTLNLAFTQWESKKLKVEADLATRFGVCRR